jgi:hypothetical protein
MNTHIPNKKMRIHLSKPIWMTKEYCELMDAVTISKTKATKTNLEGDWASFKKLHNKC